MEELIPPTVPVPLSVLTDDPELGMRQVAGPEHPETLVYAVHTSEMADPLPYLLGGELLLSAGVHCPAAPDSTAGVATDSAVGTGVDSAAVPGQRDGDGSAEEHWKRYVTRSVEAGAAALGFGIAPVHDRVPAALVRACDRQGLPLVEVPEGTPFTAVARTVWQAITQRRHQALRRLSEAQRTLAAAAAGPNPVPAVLGQLAQRLDAWAVLLTADGRELTRAGSPPSEEVRSELAALTGRLRPGPSSVAADVGDLHLSVYGLGGRKPLALGVCAPHRGPVDGSIAAVAVVLLSLLTERRAVAVEEQRSAALVRLMLGAPVKEAARLLNGGQQRWVVVHGRRRGGRAGRSPAGDGNCSGDSGRTDDPFTAAALAAALGTTLVDLAGDELRALVPAGDGRVQPQQGWALGVSAPVPVEELGHGDAEAARALRRALAERRPVVRQRDGNTADVASLVAPEDGRALARARLAPLDGHPELVETLRMWLSLHGSWDRTAVALEVHRNTVRQRMARIGRLLGQDLTEQDVRMELWFALKWR
ncbi:PucR family transcriptional regulator [Streptomyces ovatisporus]|uniref:PucR family transcriptional regulator n=1 Tax=Streptomyces ovatisporus TaxID=1128682 RepID=A0ABV9A563_9ACTN